MALVTPAYPAAKYVKLPTRSVEPHGLLFCTKAEVDCGNVREIGEVVGGFWKVEWNRGLLATEGKFQTQRYSGWDREMVEENGMGWLCNDLEPLQVRESYHPFNRSVAGIWDRIMET